MSEIINAQVEEVAEEATKEIPARKFTLEMVFSTTGIEINTQTNLTALEQLGAVELFKMNILNNAVSGKDGE